MFADSTNFPHENDGGQQCPVKIQTCPRCIDNDSTLRSPVIRQGLTLDYRT